MTITHHPDESTLISFAAGSLDPAFEILVACHLEQCQRCSQQVVRAELLGAALMEEPDPPPSERLLQFEARLQAEPDACPQTSLNGVTAPDPAAHLLTLPAVLVRLMSSDKRQLPWQRLMPGIQQLRLDHAGALRLLKIAPGTRIPRHSHRGSELTLVLQGRYRDETGRFVSGDLADLGPETTHQPIAEMGEPCVCLIAMDAPLRFHGILPTLMRPFIRF